MTHPKLFLKDNLFITNISGIYVDRFFLLLLINKLAAANRNAKNPNTENASLLQPPYPPSRGVPSLFPNTRSLMVSKLILSCTLATKVDFKLVGTPIKSEKLSIIFSNDVISI